MRIRPIRREDHDEWLPLWDGYNAFYGRSGPTALDPKITAATWERFFDPAEPMFALVAELDGRVAGLVHYLFHRSTTRVEPVCYLQDLFTAPGLRGRGAGRALIAAVGEQAKLAGVSRLYWHTRESNATARALYDQVAQNIGGIVYFQDPL
jgi:GNAT superfamily N-acetyltransferase